MNENVLDSQLTNTDLDSRTQYAGFWVRVGAAFLDTLVMLPLIGLNLYNLGYWKSLPLQILVILLMAAYKPFLEYKYGATVGKMAVDIKVVDYNGGAISGRQAIIRYLPWLLGNAINLIGLLLIFNDSRFILSDGWIQSSQVQSEIVPPWGGLASSILLIVSCLKVTSKPKHQGLHDKWAETYCIYE